MAWSVHSIRTPTRATSGNAPTFHLPAEATFTATTFLAWSTKLDPRLREVILRSLWPFGSVALPESKRSVWLDLPASAARSIWTPNFLEGFCTVQSDVLQPSGTSQGAICRGALYMTTRGLLGDVVDNLDALSTQRASHDRVQAQNSSPRVNVVKRILPWACDPGAAKLIADRQSTLQKRQRRSKRLGERAWKGCDRRNKTIIDRGLLFGPVVPSGPAERRFSSPVASLLVPPPRRISALLHRFPECSESALLERSPLRKLFQLVLAL